MESGVSIGKRPSNHDGIMGNNQQPWFHIEAVEFLFNKLKKHHVGFEFGSGSSTFWFSKFTNKIISIESDEEWYLKIKNIIREKEIKNIDINLCSLQMLEIWDIDTEKNGGYEEYSNKILEFKNNFDYISIDGVARSLCIEKSIDKLNPGGYLILDNSERPAYWGSLSKIPSDWNSFIFTNSVDQTSIYQKPF